MPAATFTRVNNLYEKAFSGLLDLTSTCSFTLTNAANPPVATNSLLSDLTPISLTNLANASITCSLSLSTALLKVIFTDDTIAASGGNLPAFRYIVFYKGTHLLGWLDYGSEVTLLNGQSFPVDFSDANGVLQVT